MKRKACTWADFHPNGYHHPHRSSAGRAANSLFPAVEGPPSGGIESPFIDGHQRRANKVKCHGTWENDRPPIAGVVGRESGEIRLAICQHSDRKTLLPLSRNARRSQPEYTDKWSAYDHLPETGREHASVCCTPGQCKWVRKDDGDGVGEVHCNTMEGIWTGVSNFLRPLLSVNNTILVSTPLSLNWLQSERDHTSFVKSHDVSLHFGAT